MLTKAPSDSKASEMCDWEEFMFTCNHSTVRLKSYCHFARNSNDHACASVKVLRKSWQQGVPCESCAHSWMVMGGEGDPSYSHGGYLMPRQNGRPS